MIRDAIAPIMSSLSWIFGVRIGSTRPLSRFTVPSTNLVASRLFDETSYQTENTPISDEFSLMNHNSHTKWKLPTLVKNHCMPRVKFVCHMLYIVFIDLGRNSYTVSAYPRTFGRKEWVSGRSDLLRIIMTASNKHDKRCDKHSWTYK